jgi:chemotaxis signal transduction protein
MDNSSTTRGHEVVVIRATTEAPPIGLLVDELAGIPAIAVSRMLPMSDATQRAGAAIVDRAVRPERPDDPLLLILNLEQLLLHTRAGQIAAARATV